MKTKKIFLLLLLLLQSAFLSFIYFHGLDSDLFIHSVVSMPCESGECWPGSAQQSNPVFQKFTFSSHVPTGTFTKMKILSTLVWHFIVANPKSNFQSYKIIFLSCSLSCRAKIYTLAQPHWFQLRFSKALESAHINQTSKPVLERLRLSIMIEYNKWKTQWHFILYNTCNCQGSVTRHYQKVMRLFWKTLLLDYFFPLVSCCIFLKAWASFWDIVSSPSIKSSLFVDCSSN